jgi:hypothetical protein
MAIKKVTGGKKPVAKKAVVKKSVVTKKAIPKTKAKATKSRGSNTAEQIGNDNQREAYNSIRDTYDSKSKGSSGAESSRSKVSKEEIKSKKKWESKKGNMDGMVYSPAWVAAESRKMQRSGGKGK